MNASLTVPATPSITELLSAVVQVGATGVWGRFQLPSTDSVQVDDWVVCQTGRGLEMGRVKLLLSGADVGPDDESVGPILRVATDSDLLTRERIERAAPRGISACNEWLEENGFRQIVLDVDVPLDGLRIYFHFLGDVDRNLDIATERLVELFDQVTEIRRFTQAVATGCGPQCGTASTGCHSCGSCALKKGSSGSGCKAS
jgi:hypothetical protein